MELNNKIITGKRMKTDKKDDTNLNLVWMMVLTAVPLVIVYMYYALVLFDN